MKLISLVSLVFSILFFSSYSLAASDGIRKNRTNECAAWLCVPGGFPSGCEAAYSAFIGRITDYTSGHHPVRKFTDLPNISNCIETDPNEKRIGLGSDTQMSYTTTILAIVPEHQECTHLSYVKDYCSEGNCFYLRKCTAWKTVPEQRIEGTRCVHDSENGLFKYDDFNQIIGSYSSPAYCTETLNRTRVFGNGVQYGNSFDYKFK